MNFHIALSTSQKSINRLLPLEKNQFTLTEDSDFVNPAETM